MTSTNNGNNGGKKKEDHVSLRATRDDFDSDGESGASDTDSFVNLRSMDSASVGSNSDSDWEKVSFHGESSSDEEEYKEDSDDDLFTIDLTENKFATLALEKPTAPAATANSSSNSSSNPPYNATVPGEVYILPTIALPPYSLSTEGTPYVNNTTGNNNNNNSTTDTTTTTNTTAQDYTAVGYNYEASKPTSPLALNSWIPQKYVEQSELSEEEQLEQMLLQEAINLSLQEQDTRQFSNTVSSTSSSPYTTSSTATSQTAYATPIPTTIPYTTINPSTVSSTSHPDNLTSTSNRDIYTRFFESATSTVANATVPAHAMASAKPNPSSSSTSNTKATTTSTNAATSNTNSNSNSQRRQEDFEEIEIKPEDSLEVIGTSVEDMTTFALDNIFTIRQLAAVDQKYFDRFPTCFSLLGAYKNAVEFMYNYNTRRAAAALAPVNHETDVWGYHYLSEAVYEQIKEDRVVKSAYVLFQEYMDCPVALRNIHPWKRVYHAYLFDAAKWNGARGKHKIENLTDADVFAFLVWRSAESFAKLDVTAGPRAIYFSWAQMPPETWTTTLEIDKIMGEDLRNPTICDRYARVIRINLSELCRNHRGVMHRVQLKDGALDTNHWLPTTITDADKIAKSGDALWTEFEPGSSFFSCVPHGCIVTPSGSIPWSCIDIMEATNANVE